MSIAQKYYQITAKIPDFVSRNNQLAMVEIIDRCYTNAEQEKICLVEAPTGTGKSFAYLLAGITHELAQQKKFIIATATKTIQSQLYSKDLPKFAKFSQIGFSYGLAKGRTNYLCPYQLELSCSGDVLNDMFNQDENEQRLYKLEEIRRLYAKGNWTGDLDQAPVIIPSKLKPFITSDRYQCIGQQCPYNQKDDCNCPFYLNREKLKNCDVIVTNHSLLLADLELGGGVALPNQPEDYYLCIDEAHNFTNYAINSFTGQFELNHSIETTKQLAKLAENNTTNSYIIPDTELSKSLASSSLIVNDLIIKLLELLKLNPILFKNNLLILNNYLNPHLTN
jgi:ATP-dependent DNA helicase DinG